MNKREKKKKRKKERKKKVDTKDQNSVLWQTLTICKHEHDQ